jgi:transposase
MKYSLMAGAVKRLHVEWLPGFAPDLSPNESIRDYLKRVELRNRCCRDLAKLEVELPWAKQRLPHEWNIICRCSTQCSYLVYFQCRGH